MKNWDDGLLPNLYRLNAYIKRYQTRLTTSEMDDASDETFRDILRIVTKHVYQKAGDLAGKANISAAALSSWVSGRVSPAPATKSKILDVVVEELDNRLAAQSFINTQKPATLVAVFESAQNVYLKTLRNGIDTLLSGESDIGAEEFHMVLTAAQAHLYSDLATKQLAGKFNTSSTNYKSWEKGETAPRTNEIRQNILQTINADIDRKLG